MNRNDAAALAEAMRAYGAGQRAVGNEQRAQGWEDAATLLVERWAKEHASDGSDEPRSVKLLLADAGMALEHAASSEDPDEWITEALDVIKRICAWSSAEARKEHASGEAPETGVLIVWDQFAWVAQGMTLDICAQGATQHEALRVFNETIRAQALVDEQHGKVPLAHLRLGVALRQSLLSQMLPPIADKPQPAAAPGEGATCENCGERPATKPSTGGDVLLCDDCFNLPASDPRPGPGGVVREWWGAYNEPPRCFGVVNDRGEQLAARVEFPCDEHNAVVARLREVEADYARAMETIANSVLTQSKRLVEIEELKAERDAARRELDAIKGGSGE